MKRNLSTVVAVLVVLAALFLVQGIALSATNGNPFAPVNVPDVKSLSAAMKNAITGGMTPQDAVKNAIQAGNGTAMVIRAALEAGVPLESAIRGALAAGETADVVARSAIDAGADRAEVARIMGRDDEGLAYGRGDSVPPPFTGGFPGKGNHTGNKFFSPSK